MRRGFNVVAITSVMYGCTDDPAPRDAANDLARMDAVPEEVATCERTFTLEEGSRDGHARPLAVQAGQARAGRLGEPDLPRDRTGLATWRAGDLVLANERFAVLIEAARRSELYDPWGGKLVGIARVSDGRLVDAADFNEVTYAVGRHSVEARSVTVLRDGSDGGPAVVRAVGMLRPVPFLDEFARSLAPGDFTDIEAAMDYELAPGSDHVRVYATYAVTRAYPVNVTVSAHAFFQRDRMPLFLPGQGFRGLPNGEDIPAVAFVDDLGMSYAWRAADGPLRLLVAESGFDGLGSAPFRLPACAATRRAVGDLVVGGTGLDGLVVALAREASTTLREIRGVVRNADGTPAEGVHVHALEPTLSQYLTRATTDAQGRYAVNVPSGFAVELHSWRSGDRDAGPVMVGADQGARDLSLSPTGTLHLTVTDDTSGEALPTRVQVLPAMGSAPSPGALWGERTPGEGREAIEFPHTGDLRLRLPVGRHRVLVSRGFAWELDEGEVEVTAGATAERAVRLRRTVRHPGSLCGDFHIHTWRSPDAEDSVRLKVAAIAGEGLGLGVRSDHEFVADFEPEIDALGLRRWVRGIGSLELTTFTYGHFGVVPLRPDPTARNGGAFEWANRTPLELFAEVRRRDTAPTIIINHPRGGTNYFDMARFDRDSGVGLERMWDTAFTAVEFFNERDFESQRDGLVQDWFALLRSRRRVFAVGSSDSHSMNPGQAVGWPRTCLALGTDDVRAVTPEQVRDAVARGRSVITGGIYLTVRGPGGRGPGEEATGTGPTARLEVEARAARWISADRVELLVDGRSVETRPLAAFGVTDPMDPSVRFRGTFDVAVAEGGSWAIVAAHGDRAMDQVYFRKRPFGVSNPVFFSR
ncbi:MAG: carboxypeptidase regulatory-like domain-containing protein [Deltaproteobacteria bacterium]|nr:carboxypeptidase regulatory-like domain-containing protein [Deltaproteobacteria bacterium]